jgi:hypothetical protein
VGNHRNKGEIKKFLESSEKENAIYQNIWDTAKAVLRGKVVAMNASFKSEL